MRAFFLEIPDTTAIQGNYQYCYLAEGCHKVGAPAWDPFEHIEVALHPLADVPGLIRREKICNALVINAFYFLNGLNRSS